MNWIFRKIKTSSWLYYLLLVDAVFREFFSQKNAFAPVLLFELLVIEEPVELTVIKFPNPPNLYSQILIVLFKLKMMFNIFE